MIDFESRYVVSDQQWQKYCEDRLEQYVNDPGDGTIPVDELNDHNAATLAYIDFLKTGDIRVPFRTCIVRERLKPGSPMLIFIFGWLFIRLRLRVAY
jgi:hypothetical protein